MYMYNIIYIKYLRNTTKNTEEEETCEQIVFAQTS